mgnify:FL=1|jgi:hypothetical protein
MPMFQVWLEKNSRPQVSEGKFQGILYEDNIEPILSKLFPNLPWKSYVDEMEDFPGVVVDKTSSDSQETYLAKAFAANLKFTPTLPIRQLPDYSIKTVLDIFKNIQPGENQGAYVKIFINTYSNVRTIDWGQSGSITIPAEHSFVLIHPAVFSYTDDQKRIWNYTSEMIGVYIKTDDIKLLVTNVYSDDCILTFDTDLTQEKTFNLLINEFRQVGKPLFICPTPTGSFSSFLKVCA